MSTSSSSLDRLLRTVVLVLGLAALALGLSALTIANVVPSTWALVALAALLSFLLGFWAIRQWYRGTGDQTAVPDIELPLATPAPGHDVDEALYRLTELQQGTTEYRNQIRERLAEVAVAVIRHRDDCTREAAVGQLEAGTWTDDDFATSFFAGGNPPSDPFGERLKRRLFGGDGRSGYERWVETTVDAVIERADMEPSAFQPEREATSDDGLLARLGLGGTGDGSAPSTASYRGAAFDDAERVADGVYYRSLLSTNQWHGIAAFTLLTVGVGVVTLNPGVLLLSAVGVGLSAYTRTSLEPSLTDLDVERRLSTDTPEPGEEVEVTVTVRNEGDSFLPDVRLIDRVPEPMRVVDGSPRIATALGSGSKTVFSYTMVAKRGEYEWPLLVLGRDFSGAIEREAIVDVDGELVCSPTLKTTSSMPVRSQTSLYSGQVDTSIGGSGLEFFSVREYQEGDPMNRIDWSRHARTGELSTIDFRQERAAKVVLLFDARDSAFVSPRPDAAHALDKNVDAAIEVFASLFDRGDLVGVAAFDTVPCWLGPGAGDAHAERARQLFTHHHALSSIPPHLTDVEGHYVDPMTHVRRQLSPESQIMLFSPLSDDYTAKVARQLDSAGHLVTIVSPDPTADRTVGQRLARIERSMRVAKLREHGIRVVDWGHDEPLGLELEHAQQRWSA